MWFNWLAKTSEPPLIPGGYPGVRNRVPLSGTINTEFVSITMSQRIAGHKAGVYGHATGTKLSGCDTSTENPRMREQEWEGRMRHGQGENCVGAH